MKRQLYSETFSPTQHSTASGSSDEKPVSLTAAAKEIGQPLWKVRRAAKAGVFPTYRFHNTRALCFISEIRAAILNSRKEGGQ